MTRIAWILAAVAAVLVLQAEPAAAAPAAAQLAQASEPNETAIVRGIQRELRSHGYDAGSVDGIAGPQTHAAIRAYQRDAGLDVDGAATRRLLDHLHFALPKVNSFGRPVMGNVLDAQRELARRGYYLGPQDGKAGPMTYRALDRFQQDAGLPFDGTIDSRVVQQIRDAPAEVKTDAAD